MNVRGKKRREETKNVRNRVKETRSKVREYIN
jgi:hypothetical protein